MTVQVDGGITEETILRAAEAGATCFVAGSSVYGVDEGARRSAKAAIALPACGGASVGVPARMRICGC